MIVTFMAVPTVELCVIICVVLIQCKLCKLHVLNAASPLPVCTFIHVYIHFFQVQDKSLSDTEVAQQIKRRLKEANVIVSYAEIARAAKDEKRLPLATEVCLHTPFA